MGHSLHTAHLHHRPPHSHMYLAHASTQARTQARKSNDDDADKHVHAHITLPSRRRHATPRHLTQSYLDETRELYLKLKRPSPLSGPRYATTPWPAIPVFQIVSTMQNVWTRFGLDLIKLKRPSRGCRETRSYINSLLHTVGHMLQRQGMVWWCN